MSGKPKISFWNNRLIERLDHGQKPIPKHWFSGSIFKSSFFDSVSIFIPEVEGFVRRTAERALPYLTNKDILKEARHLIEEEVAHSKVHRQYNKLLEKEGYNLKTYEFLTKKLISFGDRFLSLKFQLAGSACIEHLVGSMGVVGIDHGIFEGGLDERMKKVWLWHLLEEIDHRSSAFDIYTHLGGGYLRRINMMTGIILIFITCHIYAQSGLLWQSGNLFNPRIHLEGLRFMFGKKGLYRNLIAPFLAYYRPNFHPSQIKIRDSLGYRVHRYHLEEELKKYFLK